MNIPKRFALRLSKEQVKGYITSIHPHQGIEDKLRDSYTLERVALWRVHAHGRIDRGAVEEYRQLQDQPPIVANAFWWGVEQFNVIDGRQRQFAAQLRGDKYIWAYVGRKR